jgi:hypothetical protein
MSSYARPGCVRASPWGRPPGTHDNGDGSRRISLRARVNAPERPLMGWSGRAPAPLAREVPAPCRTKGKSRGAAHANASGAPRSVTGRSMAPIRNKRNPANVGECLCGVSGGCLAGAAGFGSQEIDNTIAERRRRYGRRLRERRTAGRSPLGDRAMSTTERIAGHRANAKQNGVKRPPPTGA